MADPTRPVKRDPLADRVVAGSRYLTIAAVVGSFLASITVQVYGLIRAVANAWDAFVVRDFSDEAAKEVLVDAVSTIDLFLLGTILFVFSIGFFQLFIEEVPNVPRSLKVESLADLKAKLTGVVIVALVVAFLGQAVEWDGQSTAIVALGLGIGVVILSLGFVTRYLEVGPSVLERGSAVVDDEGSKSDNPTRD
ncbi:MAG: YqhA family protein [Chloroflexi bacterium]|jgi:uncharacterized membrane protein YqhA|nr:YqhA family protein [Chloroflexota bacterium]